MSRYLSLESINMSFPVKGGVFYALDNESLRIAG
jgi:hypothetical protein